MSIEQRTAFLDGGGWLHDDYSNEITQETCFFTQFLTPSTVKLSPKLGQTSLKLESSKTKEVKTLKTVLAFTDMSLLHNLQEVEMDATVPTFKEPITLMDLSGQLTPTLEVLSSLETLGPGGPLGLLGGATFPSAEVVTKVLIQDQDPCLGSSGNLHNMDVNETFQDLSDLLEKDCMSPAASTCTTIDSTYSPTSLNSGINSPVHFFDTTPTTEEYKFPNSTVLAFKSDSKKEYEFKQEEFSVSSPSFSSSSKDNRYSEMRKKNNIASKRSRQTRREREIENEQKVKELELDNDVLRAKVRKLEELTKTVKEYLIKSVSQRK